MKVFGAGERALWNALVVRAAVTSALSLFLFAGCGPGAMTIGLDVPPESCEAIDAQPGPMWHPPIQFVVCRDERGRIFLPGPSSATPSSMLSQLGGPLSSVINKIAIPITPFP